jgi:hypothetical protein
MPHIAKSADSLILPVGPTVTCCVEFVFLSHRRGFVFVSQAWRRV